MKKMGLFETTPSFFYSVVKISYLNTALNIASLAPLLSTT